ncbi:NYN domain-containing protein [Candidatus Micrarchaeota archaeon]|nr:NYN domain-containing protein [Candidatus Micrarchaeota archaeon]
MKVMIFIDFENFRQSLWKMNGKLQPKLSMLSKFLIKKLCETNNWNCYNPRLIRTYAYTGIYIDSTIKKIKSDLERAEKEKQTFTGRIKETLEKAKLRRETQKNFVRINVNHCDFFELRTKPLQYWKGKVFQKGVDVQLAVDLVSHAYNKSFDVAIVCSGDVDLLESVKLVKNLGNKVIIFSHPVNIATAMETEADYFIDISKLNENEIKEISFEVNQENYSKENYFVEPDFVE